MGIDGTFSLSNLEKTIDNQTIKFKQVLMLVMKHEKVSTDSNGNATTQLCIEPLFTALVTDKKTDTYISFWQNMINLHAHYYPSEGRLRIGEFLFL